MIFNRKMSQIVEFSLGEIVYLNVWNAKIFSLRRDTSPLLNLILRALYERRMSASQYLVLSLDAFVPLSN